MKLKDLFEQLENIPDNIVVIEDVTKLNYGGLVIPGFFDASLASKLKSLQGSPKEVGGYFSCAQTKIKSLIGGPEKVKRWYSCTNTSIISLEGIASYVGDDVRCYDTDITSLQNIHKQIKYIGGKLNLTNKVKSHILGVMLIKGLRGIKFFEVNVEQKVVENIINKHLAGNRNVHEAHEELLEAGLEEYAQL